MREWLRSRRARREIGRRVSWPDSTLMTRSEKQWWAKGWRVTYWVCPACGHRREGRERWLPGGWVVPGHSCECPCGDYREEWRP